MFADYYACQAGPMFANFMCAKPVPCLQTMRAKLVLIDDSWSNDRAGSLLHVLVSDEVPFFILTVM